MGCSGEDVWLSPKAQRVFDCSVECKNQERPSLRKSWEQAVSNSGDRNPLLFTTWNRGDELVTMRASQFFKLLGDKNESI